MSYYRIQKNHGACPPLGGTAALADASVEELRVLLCLFEAGEVDGGEIAALARAAGCSLPRTRSALRYWVECGVATEEKERACDGAASSGGVMPSDGAASSGGAASSAPAACGAVQGKTEEKKKPLRPEMTVGEQSAAAIARTVKNENLAAFIDTAEQTVGRVFNLRELNILTGLLDTTPFSQEYLLTLISYCKTKTARFSFAYLEKTAYSMLDMECLTLEALNEYLATVERLSSVEGRLRRLFGFGERRLSPKEREYFRRWVGEFGYDEEIIGVAYDIAVNNTGKLALAYMDKLLTRFHAAGCTDLPAVEAFLERERAENAKKPRSRHTGAAKKGRDSTYRTGLDENGSATSGSSFVARDFLAAALRRSYGDEGEEE